MLLGCDAASWHLAIALRKTEKRTSNHRSVSYGLVSKIGLKRDDKPSMAEAVLQGRVGQRVIQSVWFGKFILFASINTQLYSG